MSDNHKSNQNSFRRPIIEYGNIIYNSCSDSDSKKFEQLQINAGHITPGTKMGTSHEQILSARRTIDIKMFKIKEWCFTGLSCPNLQAI